MVSVSEALVSSVDSESSRYLIGISKSMQHIYRLIPRVNHSEFPVLIVGESGTGKEIIARILHDTGPRRKRPFVPVDCATLVSTLVESELFGHVKGAFTGAEHGHVGLFESANGGTIFLDEIAEMPLGMQAKFLRVLQEREIRRVGDRRQTSLNIRICAATNRDLRSQVISGAFRLDLYYRLNVLQIRVPPLRERKTDIPLLVNCFVERFRDLRPEIQGVSPDAMAQLTAYAWPGNVRELEHAIEHAMALGSGPHIAVSELPAALSPCSPTEPQSTLTLADLERRAILKALSFTGGDKMAAAQLLGIGKSTIYRKLHTYNSNRAHS